MTGYSDTQVLNQRPTWRFGWPLACVTVGVLSATAAYLLSPKQAEPHPLWIGYPLQGEAIYQPPDGILVPSSQDGMKHVSGRMKYVIRNCSDPPHPVVIQFPPTAFYQEAYQPNHYVPIFGEGNWPVFTHRSDRIVLAPGESQTFQEPYNGITYQDPFVGFNMCVVFATPPDASDVGEPFNGCISMTARLELEEEATKQDNLVQSEVDPNASPNGERRPN